MAKLNNYLNYLQEDIKRNTNLSAEVSQVLKCGPLPRQYKDFIEIFGDFNPMEICGNKEVGIYKSKVAYNVIRQTLVERKYYPLPNHIIIISPVGTGDQWVLDCKNGNVDVILHERVDMTTSKYKDFSERYAKDFKSFLIKRRQEGGLKMLNPSEKKKLEEIIKTI